MEFFSVAVPIITYDLFQNFDLYNDFIELLTRSVEEGKSEEDSE